MTRTRANPITGMSKFSIVVLLTILLITSLIVIVLWRPSQRPIQSPVVGCSSNLKQLGILMSLYAKDHDGKYPDPNRWCDSLIKHFKPLKPIDKRFVCPGAKAVPSHYAMNPNADPNGPSDLVLLFDTKGGWNQYGGPEMLTFDNHRGKYCNIVFVDYHVELIEPNDVGRLRWEVGQNGERMK